MKIRMSSRFAGGVALGAFALLLVGCGGTPRQWDAQSVAGTVQNSPIQPVVVNSNLGVGPNRLAVGLFEKKTGNLAPQGKITARLFWLGEDPNRLSAGIERGTVAFAARSLDVAEEHQSAKRGASLPIPPATRTISSRPADRTPAAQPRHDGAITTIFTSTVTFDRAGIWGLELDAEAGPLKASKMRITFVVADRTTEPQVGESAPRTEQRVLQAGMNIADLTTAATPNPDLVDTTVAAAIASGKPVVIAFVTPAFCQTRFCGPVLSLAVQPVYQEFKGRVEFIQIEPYELAAARTGTLQPVPAVGEWRLKSEPFVFVLEPGGRVSAKFEGVLDSSELRDAITPLLPK